jgi:hypothetical protein
MATTRRTRMVEPDVFRQVYDSPASLPGKQRWVTSDADVRAIEDLLSADQARFNPRVSRNRQSMANMAASSGGPDPKQLGPDEQFGLEAGAVAGSPA